MAATKTAIRAMVSSFFMVGLLSKIGPPLLNVGGQAVSVVVGQKQVAGEIDLHARAFPNSDGGQKVQESVEDLFSGCSETGAKSFTNAIRAVGFERAAGSELCRAAEDAKRQRSAEDSCVMVVDSVLEGGCALLVEAPDQGMELVKADRVSIGHDEPVKRYGKAQLP